MKKRLVAMLLVLVMAVCAFPVCAFADNPQMQPASTTTVSKPARYLCFKDYSGADYIIYSGNVISTTQNSSWTGYVLVIQDVLDGLYRALGNNNLNPRGADGTFGPNTRAAVVCFQVAYIGPNDADGAVGPTTWWFLYNEWISELNHCNLSHVRP